ncbi:ornithine cyclodeaminase family protein [Chloroflexota bacterium]
MLLLDNKDVAQLLTIEDCIEVIEEAYQELGNGRAAIFPEGGRMDVQAPSPGKELERSYVWGAMAGVLPKRGVFALRMKSDIRHTTIYPDGLRTQDKFCIAPGTYCGLIMLFSSENAEPLAIVNDGLVQHMRVAATNAVAAKYLARKDSEILAIIGSGGMARSHSAAFCAIRPIKQIRVFSPTLTHREVFAREMSAKLNIEVAAMGSPEAAIKGADIVSSCTDSLEMVVKAAWVEPGMHLACVLHYELEPESVKKADVVIRHLRGKKLIARAMAVEIDEGTKDELHRRYGPALDDEVLPTLTDLVTGKVPGRTNDSQVTYFHNTPGSGIQFAATGAKLLEMAKAREAGRQLPTGWFLEDIRD